MAINWGSGIAKLQRLLADGQPDPDAPPITVKLEDSGTFLEPDQHVDIDMSAHGGGILRIPKSVLNVTGQLADYQIEAIKAALRGDKLHLVAPRQHGRGRAFRDLDDLITRLTGIRDADAANYTRSGIGNAVSDAYRHTPQGYWHDQHTALEELTEAAGVDMEPPPLTADYGLRTHGWDDKERVVTTRKSTRFGRLTRDQLVDPNVADDFWSQAPGSPTRIGRDDLDDPTTVPPFGTPRGPIRYMPGVIHVDDDPPHPNHWRAWTAPVGGNPVNHAIHDHNGTHGVVDGYDFTIDVDGNVTCNHPDWTPDVIGWQTDGFGNTTFIRKDPEPPAGTFVQLPGGQLDIGITRDEPPLGPASNNLDIFFEEFTGITDLGIDIARPPKEPNDD